MKSPPIVPSDRSISRTREVRIWYVWFDGCLLNYLCSLRLMCPNISILQHDEATKGWKDIGVGPLSIRSKEGTEKTSKESTPTIVIRNHVCFISCLFIVLKFTAVMCTCVNIYPSTTCQTWNYYLYSFFIWCFGNWHGLQTISSVSTFSKHSLLKPNENVVI